MPTEMEARAETKSATFGELRESVLLGGKFSITRRASPCSPGPVKTTTRALKLWTIRAAIEAKRSIGQRC